MIQQFPEMIPLKEAAERTGLSYCYLREGCLSGRFVHVLAGKKYLLNWQKLCEYLNTAGLKSDGKEQ